MLPVITGKLASFGRTNGLLKLLKSSSLRLSHLQKNRFISVKETFEEENFIDLFNLPLSQVAFEQTLEIQQVLGSTHLDDLTTDVWTYFGGLTKFRSVAAYKKLLGHTEIDPAFKWL